jgi:hypothetical protein
MFFEELIPLIILASVPVVGVVGWTLVKMTEQIFGQNKINNKDVQHLLNKLDNSEKETVKLKNRLENLEVILTAMDSETVDHLLNSHEYETKESDTQKVEQFAQNLKGAKKRLDKASVVTQDREDESVQNNLKGVVNKLLTKIDVYLDEQEMKNRIK